MEAALRRSNAEEPIVCRLLARESRIRTIGPWNDQYPNRLKKAPELCAQCQPRCVRTREMRGRSRYPDNRMVRRGPMSCPNALPKPCARRMRLVGRTLCSIAL